MMGTYELQEVISRWERGRLTTEQAVGQILLWLQELERRVRELERRLVNDH
jgi:exonuclease VII small subunit